MAKELDEWRDLFEDASISEVVWRVFALARRELKRVRDKKRKAREKFLKIREDKKQVPQIAYSVYDKYYDEPNENEGFTLLTI